MARSRFLTASATRFTELFSTWVGVVMDMKLNRGKDPKGVKRMEGQFGSGCLANPFKSRVETIETDVSQRHKCFTPLRDRESWTGRMEG